MTPSGTARTTSSRHTTALWLGDLHLDRADEEARKEILKQIHSTRSDCVLVGGDTSNSAHLETHLRQLAAACRPRCVYVVPGNHDYHGSGVAQVERKLARLSASIPNLQVLDGRQIIPFGNNTCLIGHGGWADAMAGQGHDSEIRNPDWRKIREFHGVGRGLALERMTELGIASADSIRRILPLALSRFRHVVILTHVPPFPTAVLYDHKACADERLPHYTNLSLGKLLISVVQRFPRPNRRVTVLAAHSHSECHQRILKNLSIRVGHARTGSPMIFGLLRL